MIKVTLKGGDVKEFAKGTSLYTMAAEISEGLARVCLAAEVDGQLQDLRFEPTEDCEVNFLTWTLKRADLLIVIQHHTFWRRL
ncbi:MAG: TGS domain-containing protein, partial [Clostridia bacterium]|nr:TGS domain-containing protein [Clostridia bacterium]